MKVRWLGVGVVAALVISILMVKNWTRHNVFSASVKGGPAVILVADLHEANDPNDGCAKIIRAVRQAAKRGVNVAELLPDSNPGLLRRYRVLTVPTVLILDDKGKEFGRFEGEDATTVQAVQTRLATLPGAK